MSTKTPKLISPKYLPRLDHTPISPIFRPDGEAEAVWCVNVLGVGRMVVLWEREVSLIQINVKWLQRSLAVRSAVGSMALDRPDHKLPPITHEGWLARKVSDDPVDIGKQEEVLGDLELDISKYPGKLTLSELERQIGTRALYPPEYSSQ
jgi:hypothetical protein